MGLMQRAVDMACAQVHSSAISGKLTPSPMAKASLSLSRLWLSSVGDLIFGWAAEATHKTPWILTYNINECITVSH